MGVVVELAAVAARWSAERQEGRGTVAQQQAVEKRQRQWGGEGAAEQTEPSWEWELREHPKWECQRG